jgi:hypothetical protein
MKKDTGKWCDFHKIPWHNTDECRSKQSLVAEIKDKESNPDSESDSENTGRRQIIDADPTAIVTTTTIQPEEPTDPEEGEHLFHSQMWVKGTPLHFIVDSGSQKNLISAEVVKQLGLSTTPHPQPYNIGWLHQGRDLHVSQQCRLSYGIQPFKDEVLCDVSPLDVCDVLLGQPYMWKHHAIYESRPHSVIVTLGGHLYRIPEVVPTIVPPKQCRKVVSHTTKFSFFTICSKGEQRTLQPLQPQSKHLLSNRSRSTRLQKAQRFLLHTVISCSPDWLKRSNPSSNRFMTTFNKLSNTTSPARQSNSPRFRFNKRFPLSPGNSTQWRPLLPKEGGLIQVDIGGHPPIPLARKTIFHLGSFSTVFRVPNFWGHFEALNDIFWGFGAQVIAKGTWASQNHSSQLDLSNGVSSTPNRDRMQKLRPQGS